MNATNEPAIDEREWSAQETGMRAVYGRDTGEFSAAAADYRIVAEALRSAPRSQPPDDFAAGVAARIDRQNAGVERVVSRILVTVFMATSIAATVRYGSQAWQPLRQSLGDDALAWILIGMGCLVLTWLCRQLLEPMTQAPPHVS